MLSRRSRRRAEHDPPTGFACAAAAARVAGSGGAEAEWGSGRGYGRDGVTADGSRTRLIGAAEPGGVGVGGESTNVMSGGGGRQANGSG